MRRYQTAALVLALGAVAAAGGCKDKTAAKLSRSRDATAVVVVDRTSDGVRLEPEVEPNDEPAQAMSLALPGGANGTLAGETDVDRYRVEVPAAGWMRAQVTGVEGVDLVLEVTPAEGKKPIAHCDNGPALVSEGVPNVPVQPGIYDVVVREFVRKNKGAEPRAGASPPYELSVSVQAALPEGMEREPNDSADAAGTLALGGEVRGFVGWRNDLDLWQIPLDEFGAGDGLDLDIDGVGDVEYTVRIIDAAGATRLARKAGKGESAAIRGWMPGGAPDAAYYVAIEGRRSAFDHAYRLRAQRREVAVDEEVEPNDVPAAATSLAAEQGAPAGVRRGQLTRGDTDVYAVPVDTATQRLRLSLDRSLTLSVVDAAGLALLEPTTDVASIDLSLPAGTRAFVTLSGGGAEAATAYTLKWSAVAGF